MTILRKHAYSPLYTTYSQSQDKRNTVSQNIHCATSSIYFFLWLCFSIIIIVIYCANYIFFFDICILPFGLPDHVSCLVRFLLFIKYSHDLMFIDFVRKTFFLSANYLGTIAS